MTTSFSRNRWRVRCLRTSPRLRVGTRARIRAAFPVPASAAGRLFQPMAGERAVSVRRVASEHGARYLRSRARRVQIHRGDAAALRQFLDFLAQGVIPAKKIPARRVTPVEQATRRSKPTCVTSARWRGDHRLLRAVRPWVPRRSVRRRPVTLARLCAGDVVRFVQRHAPHLHVKRAKLLTTALRSFLRYARYRGDIALDLAAAVPTVANWSMPSIPRAIPAACRPSAAGLHQSAYRDGTSRLRDSAVARASGIAGERSGASRARGYRLERRTRSASGEKAGSAGTCPLPADVGAAIAAYLRHGRPQSTSRRVFLRAKAPIRGFSAQCVSAPSFGIRSHAPASRRPPRARISFAMRLATQMLRHGASLAEIGEVLGHRSPETTKIYTKVDLDALRTLALPWPGGVR